MVAFSAAVADPASVLDGPVAPHWNYGIEMGRGVAETAVDRLDEGDAVAAAAVEDVPAAKGNPAVAVATAPLKDRIEGALAAAAVAAAVWADCECWLEHLAETVLALSLPVDPIQALSGVQQKQVLTAGRQSSTDAAL